MKQLLIFYKLKLQDNKYFRYKPKQIIGYPNEETFESTWHIDCKNSKVFSTGGIFEREYTLEKHRYDSNSKVYLVEHIFMVIMIINWKIYTQIILINIR